jgi:septal ring factor EnvC (AmiA/AmiB activator)
MSASQRIKEMEEYIKKLGELLNVIYRKIGDTESKISSIEAELSKTNEEIAALKTENVKLTDAAVPKAEYEEFMNRLIDALKGLLPDGTQQGTV